MRLGHVPSLLRALQSSYLSRSRIPCSDSGPQGPRTLTPHQCLPPCCPSSHQTPSPSPPPASGPLHFLSAWPGMAWSTLTSLKSLSKVSIASFSNPPDLQLQPLHFCFTACLFQSLSLHSSALAVPLPPSSLLPGALLTCFNPQYRPENLGSQHTSGLFGQVR